MVVKETGMVRVMMMVMKEDGYDMIVYGICEERMIVMVTIMMVMIIIMTM